MTIRERAVAIVFDRPATIEEKVARGFTPRDEIVIEERVPAMVTAQGLRLADGEIIPGMAAFKVRFPGAVIDHAAAR